jgi:4-amino-4-deoxy-L-arabinose transferase-like glycosyltransferase
MNRSRGHFVYGIVAALAMVHLGLAIVYASITPYRTAGYLSVMRTVPWSPVPDVGAPDERQHANYVINILGGNGLPVYRVFVPDPNNPGKTIRNPALQEMYEDHQAPLYYLADAAFGRITGLDTVSAIDPQKGLRLRFLNGLFGAATVVGVFFLGLWGLRRRDVAILAAAITALLPMNLALSGAVSNDPLLFCICTWTLAVCALAIQEGWNTKRYAAAGILVGFGLLTKTTALALIPIVLVAFFLRRASWKGTLGSMAIGLVLVSPWLVRNQRLYGDPLGLRSFQQLFAGAPQAKDMIAAYGSFAYWFDWVGWWTARSFFGVFSYMDIFLNERGMAYTGPATNFGPAAPNTLYRLLLGLGFIACVGFLASVSKVKNAGDRKVHILNGVFLGLITILFIRYNISFFQGQARYFYPAIGPISLGLATGAIYLAKSRKLLVSGLVVALLLMLNVYALVRLPTEFAKRINPNSVNQAGVLVHP